MCLLIYILVEYSEGITMPDVVPIFELPAPAASSKFEEGPKSFLPFDFAPIKAAPRTYDSRFYSSV